MHLALAAQAVGADEGLAQPPAQAAGGFRAQHHFQRLGFGLEPAALGQLGVVQPGVLRRGADDAVALRAESPSEIGTTCATSGCARNWASAANGMLPVGTSRWKTPLSMICMGLPLAPTTRSMPARVASQALLHLVARQQLTKLTAPSPSVSSSRLRTVTSGRAHR